MNRALYTSAIGMMTQMNNMEVITTNIANVDTTGFKRDETAVQTFSETMFKILNEEEVGYGIKKYDNNIGEMALGNYVSVVATDFSMGAIEPTKGTFDLALDGEGFFCVATLDENDEVVEKYTRDGSFTLDNEGNLITKSGYFVLGENGVINMSSVDVFIDENANVYLSGEFVDKLKIVNFENPETLRKYGENLYDSIEESEIIESEAVVYQGYIERSNVNTVTEMVKMISVARIYELGQKLVQTQDSILGKAVSDIARKV